MIDIVYLALIIPQRRNIFHRIEEILGAKGHLIFVDTLVEFPVNPESTNIAQPITVRVKKLLSKKGPGLFFVGRIAGSQPNIELQQRLFMALTIIFCESIQNDGISNFLNDFDRRRFFRFFRFCGSLFLALRRRLRVRGLYERYFVAYLRAGLDNDFAGFLIDNRFDRPHRWRQLVDRYHFGLIEQP